MPERDSNGYVRNDHYGIPDKNYRYGGSDKNEISRRPAAGSGSGAGGPPRGYSAVNSKNRRSTGDNKNRDYDEDNSRDGRRYRSHSVDDYKRRSSKERDDYQYYERRSGGGGRDEYPRSKDDDDDRRYSSSKDEYYGRSDKKRASKDDYYGGSGGGGGGGSGDYYGRSKSDDDKYRRKRYEDEDDWKCKECNSWNYPDEKKCSRCGLDRRKAMHGNGSSSSEEGEQSSRARSGPKTNREWPPCFENDGDAFVLDARSGMFYEAKSDFFYDPTSKLYYGNKKMSYFSYNAVTKKFLKVDSNSKQGEEQPAPPAGSHGAETNDQDQLMLVPNGANPTPVAEPQNKIAIKLKTAPKSDKKRKKRSESNADTATAKKDAAVVNEPATKLQKQHKANMEAWNIRGKELKQEEGQTANARPLVTKNGKPICWVCKRKFRNVKKLQLHEAKSKLHQENLAKQKEEEEMMAKAKAKRAIESGKYVDRAQQRRDMYGPELLGPPERSAGGQDVVPASAAVSTEVEVEGNTNTNSNALGQQMLEKLGWKSGSGLGRDSEQQQEQQAALAQDWDRIESLAAQNNNNKYKSSNTTGRQLR